MLLVLQRMREKEHLSDYVAAVVQNGSSDYGRLKMTRFNPGAMTKNVAYFRS